MKHSLLIYLLSLFFMIGIEPIFATKATIPFTDDGVWSLNSQPSSVYHNGSTYFAWINKTGDLVIGSYDHQTQDVIKQTVASAYGAEDFCSPAILIRSSGQILIFASKNGQELGTTGFHCFRSNSTTGDITQGFVSQSLTGYGISSTLPFAMGDNIVVFWRSKNNLGYSFFKDANKAGVTGALPSPNPRAGFLGDPGFGNSYEQRAEVPSMRAIQDQQGDIHMVITQLGTGLRFNNSTIHYLKAVNNENSGLSFYTAASSSNVSITYNNPPDVIYSTTQASDKVIAYDITLIEGKPAVLYDAFKGNNVNADTDPGKTSGHTYMYAFWNGTEWKKETIINAGEGLPIEQYTAVGGKTFHANSYYAGGLCFDAIDPSIVYLSKKDIGGTFELYRYETADEGKTWTESEIMTADTPMDQVNIRPVSIKNVPADNPFHILWLQGTYSSPANFNTSIVCLSEGAPLTALSFEKGKYDFAVGDIVELNVEFYPVSVTDRRLAFESSNTEVVEITADGKIKCIGTGTATVTAKAITNESISASCEITVEPISVFVGFINGIIADVRADKISTVDKLDQDIARYLTNLKEDGSFPDVDYASQARTNWPPMAHLDRMLAMGLGYTHKESNYFENDDLKIKMEKMLEYWHLKQPHSTNWYQNEIGEPQRMGMFLILLQNLGKEKISEELMAKSITRLKNKGGNPGGENGANRVDIALHWIYRACLTNDRDLLRSAMDFISTTLGFTTSAQGIQYDNSYTQHGRQLHIGSYGEVFMEGTSKAMSYATGTSYEFPENEVESLTKLIRESYLNVFRGDYIFYNAIGRASTRPGATLKTGSVRIIERAKIFDPENTEIYESAIARIKGEKPASYNIVPGSNHYFWSDYTIHKRPEYSVDLRMVSNRTARNEYLADNFEGKKQYFLSDGATGIFVDGNEYFNIFPVWNWAKIPGVTCPEFINIPQAETYIKMGQSGFVGGVTDSLYTVSVYNYSDTDSRMNVNTSAKKAWFFFDKEIVCLGSDIHSSAPFKVNTTVNQCLLNGDVTISSEGSETSFTKGTFDYENNLDWVFHGKIGYYFPKKGKLQLNAQEQSGSWFDINGNYSNDLVKKDVFTLSFDHGLNPEGSKYEYIIVPGLTDSEAAKAYDPNNIQIIVNSDSLQAVYHKELKIFGMVFHRACGFKKNGLTLEADAGCVVLVKDVDKPETIVYVADPKNGTNPIHLGIETPALTERRLITYQMGSPYSGQSVKFLVNEETPLSPGRDVNIERAGWIITTSIQGVEDETVGGSLPEYIIDNDTGTSFLFVKPGKTFQEITAPADYKPSFTIDMQKQEDLSYFIYRHRTLSNTTAFLRASKVSFFGKNTEEEDFTAIIENTSIPTGANIADVKVLLPEKVSYRYIRLEMTEWDDDNGNTIQVSDFNAGSTQLSDIKEIEEPNAIPIIDYEQKGFTVSVFPNPVTKGDKIYLRLSDSATNYKVKVYDITGKVKHISYSNWIETSHLNPGIYIL
ncbi:MAG: polysaccharide lyase beta-sandwich domain-containing protein, partial [Bacteroidales bacterium]|nr:polysaccharide lyase beta-sandwich domain-containing protein [Bacteroidales bacterium]